MTFREVIHSVGHVVWLSVNLLLIGGLLMADLSPYIAPSKATLPAILGICFEPLLWVNIIVALTWLLTQHKKWCLFGLAAVVLSLGSILCTYSLHPSEEGEGTALTIMTYNTHQMQGARKAKENDILRYAYESGADIICMQEFEVQKDLKHLTLDGAKNYMKDRYPYTYFDFVTYNKRRQYGLAIFSKYPLIDKETIHYDSRTNGSNKCDVLVNGKTIRLITNHLESNSFTQNDLTIEADEDLGGSIANVVKKMVKAYQNRAEEVGIVSEEIRRSPYPVIVAGDLNDVPVSYTYHNLSRNLKDCMLYGGKGSTNHTFNRGVFGIRIDHIFASKDFKVTGCEVADVDYSDHQPVVARVVLCK